MSSTIKDRRNPEKIIYYQPAPQTEEQGDLSQILSFVVGLIGVMMKQKLALWGSLFMLLSCFANLKQTSDIKQLIMNAGIVLMGMVSLYYWQPRYEEQAASLKLAAELEQANANVVEPSSEFIED